MKQKNHIKLKNNFNVTFNGQPSLKVKPLEPSDTVGISPLNYNFIKAKLVVKVGDEVKQGQSLFFDKKDPQIYFNSPVSGTITNIVYGPQRRLDLIEIQKKELKPLTFSKLSIKDATAVDFKSALLERGLWNGFIECPFYNIPTTNDFFF